jgi:hypothetical protein
MEEEMDVGVDEAGEQRGVAEVDDLRALREAVVAASSCRYQS